MRQRADAWGEIGSLKSEAAYRTIPVSPMVVKALREWKLACPKGDDGLVFPNGCGWVESHHGLGLPLKTVQVRAILRPCCAPRTVEVPQSM